MPGWTRRFRSIRGSGPTLRGGRPLGRRHSLALDRLRGFFGSGQVLLHLPEQPTASSVFLCELTSLGAGLLGLFAERVVAFVEPAGDVRLLGDTHDRLGHVVHDEGRRKEELKDSEEDGQVLHDLLLGGRHGRTHGSAGDHPLLNEVQTHQGDHHRLCVVVSRGQRQRRGRRRGNAAWIDRGWNRTGSWRAPDD